MMSPIALPAVEKARQSLKRKATEAGEENMSKKARNTEELRVFLAPTGVEETKKPEDDLEPIDMEVEEEPMSELEMEVRKWGEVLATTDEPSIALLELLALQAPLELYEKYEIQAWALEHWIYPDEELQAEINELWFYIERLKPKKRCCRNLARELQMMQA